MICWQRAPFLVRFVRFFRESPTMSHPLEAAPFRLPSEYLLQDVPRTEFHQTVQPGLYSPVPLGRLAESVTLHWNHRILAVVSVTINKKSLWVPFILDTGSPLTYLCPRTIQTLYSGPGLVLGVEVAGQKINLNDHGDKDQKLRGLNVLGMDVLNHPLLLGYLIGMLRSGSALPTACWALPFVSTTS